MSTISSALSPFDFTRVKPLKSKTDDPTDPNNPAALKTPSADLMSMIEGLMAAKGPKQSSAVSNNAQALFAPVTINGTVVATLASTGDSDTGSADEASAEAKTGGGANSFTLAQSTNANLTAIDGGTVVKASTALTQTQGTTQQADMLAGTDPNAMAREMLDAYSGRSSGSLDRQILANPSMLVQAQLFAQQTASENVAPLAPITRDTMASAGAAT